MSDVTSYDDRTVQRQTGSHRVLSQLFQNLRHRTVQIDLHYVAFTGIAKFFRNQTARIFIEFLNPDTILVDFTFDVTVGRARNSQTDGTWCTVTGQADDTYVVCQILTAELCTEADLMSFLEYLFFKFDITESTSVLITCSRQFIIIMSRSQFHSQQVFLGRSTTDYECDVIRRTGCRTKGFHLFD